MCTTPPSVPVIYPADQAFLKGMTFKTSAHGHATELVWRINEYEPASHHIEYLVMGPHQSIAIMIDCRDAGEGKTAAQVTYEFIALDHNGVALKEARAEALFADDLAHWEQAINGYLDSR